MENISCAKSSIFQNFVKSKTFSRLGQVLEWHWHDILWSKLVDWAKFCGLRRLCNCHSISEKIMMIGNNFKGRQNYFFQIDHKVWDFQFGLGILTRTCQYLTSSFLVWIWSFLKGLTKLPSAKTLGACGCHKKYSYRKTKILFVSTVWLILAQIKLS